MPRADADVAGPTSAAARVVERRGQTPEARRRRALFGLMRWIEERRPTGVVRVLLEGEEQGALITSQGRLCYSIGYMATSPAIAAMFADHERLRPDSVDSVARRASSHGRSLCESILDCGRVERERVRAGLRWRTALGALSLADGCRDAEPTMDLRGAIDDYDHRFAFSPLEIFIAASGATDTGAIDGAGHVFERFAAAAEAALLFVMPRDSGYLPYPVAERDFGSASLPEVVRIARSAAAISTPPQLARIGLVPQVTLTRRASGVWVCARGRLRLALLRLAKGGEAEAIAEEALRVIGD